MKGNDHARPATAGDCRAMSARSIGLLAASIVMLLTSSGIAFGLSHPSLLVTTGAGIVAVGGLLCGVESLASR